LGAYLHSTARGRLDPRAVMTVVGTEVQGLLQGVGHQRDCVEISRIVLAGIFFVVNGVINTAVVAYQPCVTVRHTRCDGVFAVIDTASKTGTEHDATAVTFFARNNAGGRFPLMILDWDIAQIEGALLETWLPMVFDRLEELARLCQARHGSLGAFIEDKNTGTILLQQVLRRGTCAGYRL
jgi:hypothetical protein